MEVTPVKKYDLDQYPEMKERLTLRGALIGGWSLIAALAAIGILMQGCHGPS